MPQSMDGNYNLNISKYDLSTYWGRVKQAAIITDPRTLFVSASQLEHAKSVIAAYKSGQTTTLTPELWASKRIVDSTLHPDTGELIPLPFRMSCYVYSNLLVTVGMLTPGLKTFGSLAWQTANQTLNVCINISNANKSTPLSTVAIIRNYVAAVVASCSVVLGLNSLVPRLKNVKPSSKILLSRLIPFAAVASTNIINVFFMRSEEIRHGIDVFPVQKSSFNDPLGNSQSTQTSVGKSKRAAILAVSETALSRVINATPVMVLPPIILFRLQKFHWLRSQPSLTFPVNCALILTSSIFALPLAIAVFPQRRIVPASFLEPEISEKLKGKNSSVEFNRGL